jgi:hypothetical protein
LSKVRPASTARLWRRKESERPIAPIITDIPRCPWKATNPSNTGPDQRLTLIENDRRVTIVRLKPRLRLILRNVVLVLSESNAWEPLSDPNVNGEPVGVEDDLRPLTGDHWVNGVGATTIRSIT